MINCNSFLAPYSRSLEAHNWSGSVRGLTYFDVTERSCCLHYRYISQDGIIYTRVAITYFAVSSLIAFLNISFLNCAGCNVQTRRFRRLIATDDALKCSALILRIMCTCRLGAHFTSMQTHPQARSVWSYPDKLVPMVFHGLD